VPTIHDTVCREMVGTAQVRLCPPYEISAYHSPLIMPASINSRLNLLTSAPFLQE
jgi:hypothetical protein